MSAGLREVLEIDQLPSGHWYASKHRLTTYDDPESVTTGYSVTWNVDVRVLDEGSFPADFFDGRNLLEQAKEAGADIETQ